MYIDRSDYYLGIVNRAGTVSLSKVIGKLANFISNNVSKYFRTNECEKNLFHGEYKKKKIPLKIHSSFKLSGDISGCRMLQNWPLKLPFAARVSPT